MYSNFIKTSGYVVALILVSGLGACGGGGSGTADSSGYGSGNVNARPSLSVASSIQVDENQTAVTVVSASDADGDDLSFSLSGDDANAFEIDSDGTISVCLGPRLRNEGIVCDYGRSIRRLRNHIAGRNDRDN